MKVVLTRPHYESHIITPPLGLGYLASALKRQGIAVTLIDGLRERVKPEILLQKIVDEKPDAVGISCLTAYYWETVQLSRALKEKKIRCVIGGPHPTVLPYQTLVDSKADGVICGEGEMALPQLVARNFKSGDIPGVYTRENLSGEDPGLQRTEIVENLDDIPFPDWEQMDPRTYPKAPHGAIVKHFPIGAVTTSRGCPFACTFCASPKLCSRRIRYRSPENVIREIEYLVDRFGVREIHFEDDNLTLERGHIEKICRLMIERRLKVRWACPNGIRADRIDEDLACLMRKSGCYFVAFGIESANPGILHRVKKMETVDQISRAIDIARRAGIASQGFFIFGLPGETVETMAETLAFAKASKLDRAQFLILDVLPGSELWDTLGSRCVPNWRKKSYKEPEWLPEGLSKEQLMKAQARAFRAFYARPAVFMRLAKSVKLGQIKFLVDRLREFRIVVPSSAK